MLALLLSSYSNTYRKPHLSIVIVDNKIQQKKQFHRQDYSLLAFACYVCESQTVPIVSAKNTEKTKMENAMKLAERVVLSVQ